MTDYNELNRALEALTEGVPHPIANLANASALLFSSLDRLNWAGFYLLEGDRLVLGPFQGKPACIEIPIGRGVCGTAAELRRTLVVPDVHKFPGHIACDGASNSEIVIPLISGGRILGVLDIDSPVFDRFSDTDRAGLEKFAEIICKRIKDHDLP
ncbi:MAG: GAF domain-containing protein [Clostridia bacterium]|nr:GAF domain-containing protein [Clostridia bacterium]